VIEYQNRLFGGLTGAGTGVDTPPSTTMGIVLRLSNAYSFVFIVFGYFWEKNNRVVNLKVSASKKTW
jgi:hypothetical protein